MTRLNTSCLATMTFKKKLPHQIKKTIKPHQQKGNPIEEVPSEESDGGDNVLFDPNAPVQEAISYDSSDEKTGKFLNL